MGNRGGGSITNGGTFKSNRLRPSVYLRRIYRNI